LKNEIKRYLFCPKRTQANFSPVQKESNIVLQWKVKWHAWSLIGYNYWSFLFACTCTSNWICISH